MSAAVNDLQEKISKFLSEELARKEIRTAVRVELVHSPAGFRSETLKEWRREDEADAPYFSSDAKDREAYLEALAQDILQVAEERADVFRVADNTFTLRTYQHGGGRRGYAFRIMPGLESDGGGGNGTTAMTASHDGVLAMQMRNNEFAMRQNKDMIAGTIGVLTTIAEDLRKENRDLREERARLVAEINLNRANEAERELAVVRQAGSESRKDMIVGKAVGLLPVLASRLLPESAGGGGGEAVKALLAELGSSIKPNQLAALASVLTTEQRITFAELMKIASAGSAPAVAPPTPGSANGSAVKG